MGRLKISGAACELRLGQRGQPRWSEPFRRSRCAAGFAGADWLRPWEVAGWVGKHMHVAGATSIVPRLSVAFFLQSPAFTACSIAALLRVIARRVIPSQAAVRPRKRIGD